MFNPYSDVRECLDPVQCRALSDVREYLVLVQCRALSDNLCNITTVKTNLNLILVVYCCRDILLPGSV